MKLKIIIIAALLFLAARSMVVQTQSAYSVHTSASISITPDTGH